jgi:hypothetical protein
VRREEEGKREEEEVMERNEEGRWGDEEGEREVRRR